MNNILTERKTTTNNHSPQEDNNSRARKSVLDDIDNS